MQQYKARYEEQKKILYNIKQQKSKEHTEVLNMISQINKNTSGLAVQSCDQSGLDALLVNDSIDEEELLVARLRSPQLSPVMPKLINVNKLHKLDSKKKIVY